MTDPRLTSATFTLVESFEEAAAFKRWLGERHENNAIAFDLETSGLRPRAPGAAVRLCQFGDTRQGWALPWGDWRGLALEALEAWGGDLVTHHGKFDINWAEAHSGRGPGQTAGAPFKIDRHQIHDTLIQARILYPTGSGSLKELSDRFIDRNASRGQTILKDTFTANDWSWDTIPITVPAYWQYACLDTVITALLHDKFYPRVRPGTDYHNVYELEMAASDIIGRMEARGVRVDVDYARMAQQKLLDEAQVIRDWGKRAHGISLGSSGALAKRFVDLGCELTAVTATGQLQVDKYVLHLLADPDNEYPKDAQDLARNVLRMRKDEKFAAAYFGHIIDDSVNGVIHPSIHSIGARTGRMSISAPALQQLPKGDALVRSAFIPREGNLLVSSDYNQIEMRMVAHFSDDADLIAAFEVADRTGSDFFTEMGKTMYGPGFTKKDKRRGPIKNTLYGMCYGAGVAKMAESAGLPIDKMREIVKDIEHRYPGIRKFMAETEDIGKRREFAEGEGYVFTPMGRRLPCDTGKIYALTNYQIQGGAAEVYKAGLIRLDAAGYGDYFAVPVHDEIVLDIPQDLIPGALHDVPDILTDRSLRVPVTADAEGGFTSWGSKYE